MNHDTEQRFVDSDLYRDVIGRFASGVTVITARHEDTDFGLTASAVTSLSMEPPTLLVCVNRDTGTNAAIAGSGAFAVNILDEDQGDLAMQFAQQHPDKFRGLEVSYGELGEPLLDGVLAHLECRVAETVQSGTHSVFLAHVQHADAQEGTPLAYFRGELGRFAEAADEQVYARMRRRILQRDLPLGHSLVHLQGRFWVMSCSTAYEVGRAQPGGLSSMLIKLLYLLPRRSPDHALDIGELAYGLDVPQQSVYYALAKLSAEGLISRREEGGYVITPVDVKSMTEALDARGAIEAVAAERSVGRLSAERLGELRKRMEATLTLVSGDRFTGLERYVEANAAFHEYLVELAENETLLNSYRGINAEKIMWRALRESLEASDSWAEEHTRIVEAYEAGDVEAAKRTIHEHTEEAKSVGRRAIEGVGGRV